MRSYSVSVHGPIPSNLAQRIAEAHALAIQKKPTNSVKAPAGKKVKPSMGTIRTDS